MFARQLDRPPGLRLLEARYPEDLRAKSGRCHYRKSREHLLYRNRSWDETPFQARVLAWFRDNVHKDIPRKYRELLLGHDIHLSQHAELYVRHFHASERDPFTGKLGWTEDLGRVSSGKVTTAYPGLRSPDAGDRLDHDGGLQVPRGRDRCDG
jgi:hypothetical protein